ncbi:MAG: isoprenylcysteine carboxylmethyltransferase family protein [Candidatus Dormibacteraeota bacterium]|nr:isoprenylcysteine carboxylmethyltransferase family protein [Candidatus Dormibacteraeota bacterium]
MVADSVATSDPKAAALWGLLAAIWTGGELVIFGRSSLRRGARTKDRGSLVLILGAVLVGLTLAGILARSWPGAAIHNGRYAVFFAGAGIMAAGIALRFAAVIVLGRFFTVAVMVGSDQRVVDSGPYRWIRHPAYTGALLALVGSLLCTTNWAVLAGVVPVLLALLYRIKVEEQALSDELGDAYRSYIRRTKRLVPFLY